jgi:hypothetical protein
VRAALERGKNREREDDQGSQIYSLLFVPIQDLGYVNIYARDITAVRRAEQESRQHQSELVHVCRLSTMGEVATGMAHELNQPLAAIVNYAKGASRRLQGGIGDSEPLVDAMRQISSQAQRAGEIIRRLRALVGKQPPIRSVVDLNYLVREVCGFVEFETGKLDLQVSWTWPRARSRSTWIWCRSSRCCSIWCATPSMRWRSARSASAAVHRTRVDDGCALVSVATMARAFRRSAWSTCSIRSSPPRRPAWAWACRSVRPSWRTTTADLGRVRARHRHRFLRACRSRRGGERAPRRRTPKTT